MEEFGKHLRYSRKQRRMTQTELAHIVGVAPAYVSQIESSLRMPSLKVAKRFADALGVELPVLLGTAEAAPTPDRLTDPEKVDLLRSVIRSIEFDAECRPRTEDAEPHPGATAMEVSDEEESAVRFYRYGDRVSSVKYLQTHPGQEIVYCAAGRLRVVVESEERALTPGESFSFDATRPHTVLGEPGSVAVSTAHPPPNKATVQWIPVDQATGVNLDETAESSLSAQAG